MNKLNLYVFKELLKGFFLIFFIFISIAWLLQFTRLISISNLLQIDTLSILILSIYLIPNLFTIILPFIVIIGISITFIKLYKDREIISIYLREKGAIDLSVTCCRTMFRLSKFL